MELILVVVGAILVTAIAHRKGLQPALVLVIVGFAVSFTPGFRGIELDSGVLLSVVLPPLLYSAALGFSFPTFLHNIKPILGLGVVLVIITAFAVAGVASWLVGPLTFATALVLGAVVAPPDAVTAVAIGRKLGLPHKVIAILTGESLVNDAAALSLFITAVAWVVGIPPFIENPVLLFLYSTAAGSAVGAALGFITLWIRRRLAHPGLETVQGLVLPFAAFLVAERLYSSGVLAVVIAGFVVGHGTVRDGYRTRLQDRYVWNVVHLMLEAFVFAYIGLQLRFVLEDLRAVHASISEVAIASVVVLITVLLIRPLCVFVMFRPPRSRPRAAPGSQDHRRRGSGVRRRGPHLMLWQRNMAVRSLTWRDNVILSWTSMRGVVTLAAASGIPLTTADGSLFPERATIQGIAFAVAVGTLLLQGWTLPLLIRWLRPAAEEEWNYRHAETTKAEQLVRDVAAEVLDHFEQNAPPHIDPETVANIRNTIARQAGDVPEMPDPEPRTSSAKVFSGVFRDVLAAQRTALIRERDAANIDEEVVRPMLERLDLQEAGVAARLESS